MAVCVVAAVGHWAVAVAVVVMVALRAIWTPGHPHGFGHTEVLVRVGCSHGSDNPYKAWRILGSTCS